MKGLEHWGDMKIVGSAGNDMCKSILNMLKAHNLNKVSKVKLYIAPVKPASEGNGVFSGAC